ncbi:CCA tRNA nucleotidyltransferase [Dankookia rubra]|uniref:CCA tRNA nucleotidyltransferase n=1 Tax=Dankookia rubra TaxID=1442381 RepID=A0A4R5QAM5_9PROT|nr:CCA tRNA nucleotidyltransferase [Dankookia rubra]
MLQHGAPAAVLAALPGARAVGGVVRDVLAGRPVQDVDVGAPLPPDAVAARLRRAGLRVFETGLAHGTVTAVLDHVPVEVTSLRRDVATDGRHAEVEWTTDWREDAARRDFTFNAMSMAADGALWDYFGGRADLAAGRVRFVGDPATRLAEDTLRALRFFRFQARYGRGAPDPAALAAIRAAVPGLARLSAERVWMELKRLLAAPDPAEALASMAETGVLAAVLPEGAWPGRLGLLLSSGLPQSPLVRLAAMLRPEVDLPALAQRLRLSGEEAARLDGYRHGGTVEPGRADAATLNRLLTEADAETLLVRSWLRSAAGAAAGSDSASDARHAAAPGALPEARRSLPPGPAGAAPPGDWAGLAARLAALPRPVFPLQGRDALALGLPPGPEIGRLLAATRAWWLARGCADDAEACRARLRELAGRSAI